MPTCELIYQFRIVPQGYCCILPLLPWNSLADTKPDFVIELVPILYKVRAEPVRIFEHQSLIVRPRFSTKTTCRPSRNQDDWTFVSTHFERLENEFEIIACVH